MPQIYTDTSVQIPHNVLAGAGFVSGDIVVFEIANEKIVVRKKCLPEKGTLEYLFKDYDGDAFQAELIDLGEPAGMEKW